MIRHLLTIAVLATAAIRYSGAATNDIALPATDQRFSDVRFIERTYEFPPPKSKAEWQARAADLRLHMLVSTGLYPLPPKTPLNAKIFGRIEHDDYTVEKVYFESYPGFLCTGNLYRPKGKKGPFPGILNPHGHWAVGRFGHDAAGSVPGRCIIQARLGFVAFTYDMVAYNDSLQVPNHRQFAVPSTPEGQRLNLWGISVMGLQTWNSLRAIDFLQSLPDVDPKRIACTGESGGGTQTYMVSALDERIIAASPVNMVSGIYQGGCLCENGPGLRTDANNMEFTALIAPRPLFLVSCTGDWTKNTPKLEFPAIQNVYKLFNVPERVGWMQLDTGHNYNQQSREGVYGFLAHNLIGRADATPIPEPPFTMEKVEDLRVFPDKKLPANAVSVDDLCQHLITLSENQLEAVKPRNHTGLKNFSEVYGPALRHALSVEVGKVGDILASTPDASGHFFIGRKGKGDKIPATLFTPAKIEHKAPATLVVHAGGKASATEVAEALRKQGHVVLAIDCFLTGDSAGQRKAVEFFAAYNLTDTAERVQDILTALVYLKGRSDVAPGKLNLVGLDKAGLWCLLARGLMPEVSRAAIDVTQFDNASDDAFVKNLFAPSLRRAGDLRTAAALAAPGALFIHNAGTVFRSKWIADVYHVAGADKKLRVEAQPAGTSEIVSWIGER